MCTLIDKYNVPGPRYTSYPTVPYWNTTAFSGKTWKANLIQTYELRKKDGIGIYIHLPFCESMCTFCGCYKRITTRHELEVPYLKNVLKELSLYVALLGEKPKLKTLHLGGGTPTFFSPENLKFLLSGIRHQVDIGENPEMSFEGHPNNTTKAHLQLLYENGFRSVCFGIQDYNSTVQQAIHRIQPFKNVENVTRWAREIGYTSIGHDIIYGLPHQNLNHIKETIAKTAILKPDRLAFYSYAHVPWRKGNGQRGYKESDLPSTQEKRVHYETGKIILKQIGYKDIGMDHFALSSDPLYKSAKNGTLHRNFMGYTVSKTKLLLGLGVSSIGDSWNSFAQNTKSLEAYEHLIAHNILPIERGHHLTPEDLIIRKHILNLMCNFQTSWKAQEDCLPNMEPIYNKLQPLQKDGLLNIAADTLSVTSMGRPYIRNICMAFDLHLQAQNLQKPTFSMTV